MNFNFDLFTWVHVVLSLVALATGIIIVLGLLGAKSLPGLTVIYLLTSVATDVTGFGFPFTTFQASHWITVISLVVLLVAILARYVFQMAGAWHLLYSVCMVASVYFLVLVTIAQAFMKVPGLKAMAPNGSEPPFVYTQAAALALFVVLAIAAVVAARRHSAHA